MRTPVKLLGAAAVVVSGLFVPQVAHSQAANKRSAQAEAADNQMMLNYRLTMANVNKVVAATDKFRQLEKKNPKLAESLEKNSESDNNAPLSTKIAQIEKVPEVRSILASTGLTARDYMLTLLSLMTVGAAVQIKKMGGDASSLPVSPQQLQFYKSNQAAIDRISKRLSQEQESEKAAAPTAGEDTTAADSQ